jgi:hypothetical protein
LIEWVLKGASPAGACQQLGVPIEQFWQTVQHQPAFARRLQQAFDTLSLNVLAVLYQAAMKGQTSAQQFWLRHRPIPFWSSGPASEEVAADDFERLTDAELLECARQAGVALPIAAPASLAARLGS